MLRAGYRAGRIDRVRWLEDVARHRAALDAASKPDEAAFLDEVQRLIAAGYFVELLTQPSTEETPAPLRLFDPGPPQNGGQ